METITHPKHAVNISQAEPDMDLFRPPSDYTLVDEAGPTVTIHYGQ